MKPDPMNQLGLLNDDELDRLEQEIQEAPAVPLARDTATQIREFHGWTLNKLDVFALYLKMYRRVAGGGAFIDGFAGTGRGEAIQHGRKEVRDGSALIAARSTAFASLDLVEKDPKCFDTLENAVADLEPKRRASISTHAGDCNEVIPTILDTLDPLKPCFTLLDQESTQLRWGTVEALSNWKDYEPPSSGKGRPKSCKVELWILFNSHQVINRLWPHDRARYPASFSPATLDRLLGDREAWWDLWQAEAPASALVGRYAERLRSLGYVYAIPQVIKDPATGRPQYHMIHATDHPSATSFMRWAKRASSRFEDQPLPGLGAEK